MAMMGSTAWNGQDHGLHPGADEDFQQFLDMNDMDTLADGLQFDFAGFPNTSGSGSHMLPPAMAQAKDALDTPMTGAENMPTLLSRTSNGSGPAVTSAISHAPLTPAMMAPPTPSDAISEIDAQIQYLQQQRLQRQLEEQSVAFFTRQNQIVPPTPQSLDLQAGNQYFDQQQQQHSQHQQHQQHQHSQQGHQLYERFQHLKEQQDMSFTPLVSPAVTPLETQFPVDSQFTMPGAYFSPLTSPALHAQTDSPVVFDPRLSTTGTSPIDMDLETLPAPAPMPTTSTDLGRKARKNNAKSRKANVRQSPITKPQRKRTSTTPVINAQVLDQLAESLEQEALTSPVILQQGQQHAQHAHRISHSIHLNPSSSSAGATDSENGSVSPETLTDMPPPPLPKPRSARPSPYLHPQNNNVPPMPGHMAATSSSTPMVSSTSVLSTSGGFPSPATPASLMKLASPQQKSHKPSADSAGNGQDMPGSGSLGNNASAAAVAAAANDHIENFELPESLNMDFQKPQAALASARNTPSIQTQTTASPSLEALSARASSFQPLPSPIFAKPPGSTIHVATSASQSPQLLPGSHVGTPAMQSQRKTPLMLPRGSKKRASISSVQVSPALRPRISPSIKPLLPGGVSAAEDQASRLLATKSNYQNILEGNTVPGVSYPSELSTNLTSKRTSHKIAEQGRRNRINQALQEIATLLPPLPTKEGGKGSDDGEDDSNGSGGKKDGKGGNVNGSGNANSGPNSKASTVEMAIEYIKQLQQELANATKRAEEAEKKLQLKDAEAEAEEAGTAAEVDTNTA